MCECVSPLTMLLGNGSVNTHPRATNTYATIELFDVVFSIQSVSIKYSICSERKVADQFFPELLVYNTASCLCFPISHKMNRHINVQLRQ
jgi:hypothetical protein